MSEKATTYEPLVAEDIPEDIKKRGFFERIFGCKLFSLKFFAFTCGFLIFCALVVVVAHLARFVRVLLDEKKTVDGHGIDADLFNRFNLFEQYSAAAYCPQNTNTSHSKLLCVAKNCPLVEAADTTTQVGFSHSQFTDATGFVAVDNTNKLVVISFRGTASTLNEITDVNYTRTESDLCPGCLVHQGFWFSWTEARNETLTALTTVAKLNPTYKVVVTGHSLGAAIATFCAAEIRKMGFSASLYTFGSPRVGSSTTADFIGGQSSENYRITHYNDIVPHLPPLDLPSARIRRKSRDVFSGYDFVHLSPEYYIAAPTNVTVSSNDISTYYGLVNFKGNTGQAVVNVDAHLWYFNHISICGHVS